MVAELRAPERVLLALRRISRAVDLHSRRLLASHRLTSPQLLLLREISSRNEVSLSRLAQIVSLSNATITGIVDRLERDGLIARQRSHNDRRVILVRITEGGCRVIESAPPILQSSFLRQLEQLPDAERAEIVQNLERVAEMMHEQDSSPSVATRPADGLGRAGRGESSGDAHSERALGT